MIIYELEADYSNYLAALGAPNKLVRKYAYRNALLPQITGLALALGAVVAGAIVVEIVFSYPGLGTLTLSAIQNRDYFLIQGIFLFLIIGVLIANLDHRHRLRLHRPAHARRDAGRRVMAVSAPRAPSSTARPARRRRSARRAAPGARAGAGAPLRVPLLRAAQLEVRLRRSALVLVLLALAIFGPMLADARAARVHRADRRAAVVRLLVRDDLVRPGRLLAVRPRPARGVPRRRASAAGSPG